MELEEDRGKDAAWVPLVVTFTLDSNMEHLTNGLPNWNPKVSEGCGKYAPVEEKLTELGCGVTIDAVDGELGGCIGWRDDTTAVVGAWVG